MQFQGLDVPDKWIIEQSEAVVRLDAAVSVEEYFELFNRLNNGVCRSIGYTLEFIDGQLSGELRANSKLRYSRMLFGDIP